jgi:excinuclease ABC subunit C
MTPPPGQKRDLPPEADDALDLAETSPEPVDEPAQEEDAPQTPESVKRGVAVISATGSMRRTARASIA